MMRDDPLLTLWAAENLPIRDGLYRACTGPMGRAWAQCHVA